MGTIALSLPVTGLPNTTEDPKVTNDLTLIQNVINGNLDGANVATTAGFVRLVPVTMGSNATAVAGTLVGAVPGVTVTLPAPTANIVVGVYAGVGVTGASPVTVAGTNIYGVGLSAASSFKLGVPIAAVVLQSDGTNWFVVSGQQDTGWITMSLNSGWSAAAGNYVPAVRLVGDQVRLRGVVAETSTVNPITTLASQFRPAATVLISTSDGSGIRLVQITTAGVMTSTGAVLLDGFSYALV